MERQKGKTLTFDKQHLIISGEFAEPRQSSGELHELRDDLLNSREDLVNHQVHVCPLPQVFVFVKSQSAFLSDEPLFLFSLCLKI